MENVKQYPSLEDAVGKATLDILLYGSTPGDYENPLAQVTLNNFEDMLRHLPGYRGIRPSYDQSVGIVYRDGQRYMYITLDGPNASLYCHAGDESTPFRSDNIPYADMLQQAMSFWKA